MGKVQFQINVLNNPILSFFPGQPIVGNVTVVTDKECKNDGIYVKFEGKASVHWTETRTVHETHGTGSNRRTTTRHVTEHFTAKEEYFEYKLYLLGTGGSTQTIFPGSHSFPFQFTLPPNLPSSFVAQHGMVWYEIEAVMKRSWKSNYKARVPFTVNGILDLNLEVGAKLPVDVRKFKTLCCLCCKSGPVGFVLTMKRKGFVSGEYVQFTAEVNNNSNKKVKGVSVHLFQVVTFHSTRKSISREKIICSARGPAVERGETEIWRGNILKIPPLPPTKLATCRIIDVQYVLKIEMDLAGPSINLRESIPIIIGSIPLQDTFQDIFTLQSSGPSISGTNMESGWNVPALVVPSTNAPSAPSPDLFPDQTSFLRNTYPDMPPPTYAEAMQQDPYIHVADPSEGSQNEGFSKEETVEENDPHPKPSAPAAADFMPKYLTYS